MLCMQLPSNSMPAVCAVQSPDRVNITKMAPPDLSGGYLFRLAASSGCTAALHDKRPALLQPGSGGIAQSEHRHCAPTRLRAHHLPPAAMKTTIWRQGMFALAR